MNFKGKFYYVKRFLFLLAASLFWIAVWYLISVKIAKPLILPSPFDVFGQIVKWCLDARFFKIIGTSLLNVLCGVLLGLLFGTVFAILTSYSPFFSTLFTPLITVIKVTPIASFILLLVLWMKRESIPSFISVMIVLPIVWANIASGIKSVDKNLVAVSRVYKLPLFKRLRYLYFPTLMPYIFSSFRSSLGLAWKAGISAEILTSPMNSIGREMLEANTYLWRTELFAWTVVVILLSLIMEKVFVFILDRFSKKFVSKRGQICLQ